MQKLGEENVFAFVDNRVDFEEDKIDNISIIPYSVAKEYKDDTIYIITTGLEFASEIAEQLREDGIFNYLFWQEVNELGKIDIIKKCEILTKTDMTQSEGLNAELLLCRGELKQAIYQRDYLLFHTDPSTMKPAKGYLRERQLNLVAFSQEVFEMIGEDIHPILAAGNLLGLIRHGGFIPWDDDMDLKLVRGDYSKLVAFCRKKFFNTTYYGKSVYAGGGKEIESWINNILKSHPNEIVFIEMPYHVQIWRGTSYRNSVYLDFFVIDSYKDEYSFIDHQKTISDLKKEMMAAENCKDVFSIIEKYQKKDMEYWTKESGNNFFYGFDNVESYDYYRVNENWITREMLFPLKKVNYEGGTFYIPNNPEQCLEYVFGDCYMNLPSDIALHTHI